MTAVRLLIVADKRGNEELSRSMEPIGLQLLGCETGSDALRLTLESPPHLIVFDSRDDPLASLQLCKSLRSIAETDGIPLIVLCGAARAEERVRILEAGADDCWPEPIESREFHLRLKAFARRLEALNAGNILRYADIELDADRYRAKRGGTAIDLTPMQLKLLRHLMLNPSVVFSRKRLLNEVWEKPDLDQGAVTACVVRLRKSLNKAGPNIIKHVPFAGYVLEADDAPDAGRDLSYEPA